MITRLLSTLSRFALPLLIFYVALITTLSLISLNNLPKINTGHDDKIFHALAYAVFFALVLNYLQIKNVTGAIWIAMIVPIVYGIVIEFLQESLSTARTFDVYDMLANAAGVIIGFIVVKLLYKLKLN